MARCERGYLCEVCGAEVEEIIDSDLYLAYVLGEVPSEELHLRHERHIRCNPERRSTSSILPFCRCAVTASSPSMLLDPRTSPPRRRASRAAGGACGKYLL